MKNMTIQLTQAEIQNISQLLQDYAPAQKTLALINYPC